MLQVKRKPGAIATHPDYGKSEPAEAVVIRALGIVLSSSESPVVKIQPHYAYYAEIIFAEQQEDLHTAFQGGQQQ